MPAIRFVLLCAALALASMASAQTTYRWIDKATGKTVFSDQPPPPGAAKDVETKEGKKAAEDKQQLPYATKQAAEKYPVTLYTTADCTDACAGARTFLNGRGIPFSERMLQTQEEFDEAAKLMGNKSFIPGLKVGSQTFAGFEKGSWDNLLDLAGYPKTAPYGSKPVNPLAQ